MIPLLTKMVRTYIKFLLTTRKGKIQALLLIVPICTQFGILLCFCLMNISGTGLKSKYVSLPVILLSFGVLSLEVKMQPIVLSALPLVSPALAVFLLR